MRNSSVIVNRALLHMIGQMEDMLMACSTADVAAWAGVTKPTALKYLKSLEDTFHLNRFDDPYRPNRSKYLWELSEHSKAQYRKGEYCTEYKIFMNNKWGM